MKTIDALKPRAAPYRVSDGGGLLLEVRPSGAKVWLCRLTVDGKRRDMGLGGYPAVSLKDARAAARAARRMAARRHRPYRRAAAQGRGSGRPSARRPAEAAGADLQGRGGGLHQGAGARLEEQAHGGLWRASLARMPSRRSATCRWPMWIAPPCCGPWQGVDHPPGHRAKVLRRIGTVLRYAAAHGWRANDNPADARMLRHAGLPALPGGRKQPSLSWQRVPAFMKALDGMPGLAPLALRFCILTALRSGEVRGARWSELSFDGGAVWTVPGERMKAEEGGRGAAPPRAALPRRGGGAGARLQARHRHRRDSRRICPGWRRCMGDALIFPCAKRDHAAVRHGAVRRDPPHERGPPEGRSAALARRRRPGGGAARLPRHLPHLG